MGLAAHEYEPQRSREELEKIAKERGLVAVFPFTDELFIDLDGAAKLNDAVKDILYEQKMILRDVPFLFTKSKNDGRHVYIKLSRSYELNARLCLQACLGSDPKREVLSFKFRDSDEPTVLFELPGELERVEAWRAEHARKGKGRAYAGEVGDLPFDEFGL